MSVRLDKVPLRRELFSRIHEIGPEARQLASSRIAASITAHPLWNRAKVVLTYAPLASEPDLWSLFEKDGTGDKRFLFTAIEKDEIVLYAVDHRDQLIVGEFGILEPDASQCDKFERWKEIDLLLIPGVGFNMIEKARLGRGKGHYDRFLETLREVNPGASCFGVCFSVQLEDVPLESHDQPVDHVISEAGCDEIEWIIGLGSNVGDRGEAIAEACRRLEVRGCSSLYETTPVDCEPGTPDFLNAVASFSNAKGPFQMLRQTQALEVELGRPSDHGYHKPRTIDIDLLFAGEAVFRTPQLSIPHPRWSERDFVLEPLRELIQREKIDDLSHLATFSD